MEQMRNQTLQAQMNAALENEAFCEKLLRCANAEQVHQVMVDNGMEVTLEEVRQLQAAGEANIRNMEASDGELDLEMLDQIAGGGKAKRVLRGVASMLGGAALGAGMGVICGVCPAFTPVATKVGVGYAIVATAWTLSG